MDGKLYVGTHGFGLQVFDPKTATWKSYSPEQGLPSRDVDEFFPIGGQMLYCNTKRTHYTLKVKKPVVSCCSTLPKYYVTSYNCCTCVAATQ